MTTDASTARWRQLKVIFQDVADLPAAERARAVAEKCGNDSELREEIESLLAADDLASRVLGESAVAMPDIATPEHIGPYRVVREVSRGGMGTIYLGQREDDFRRQVAIKVIRGAVRSDEVVRRFRIERQILANLDHPYVARLLDGGTTSDGLPYFVMEYVEGVPIDRYCNDRNLSIAERLRLFIDVCAAVQYAHQNLIVHRDIKPSNILITADGTPKLLDFGISKLLDESATAEQTATELRAMTPEYASPEQVAGLPITTNSDIYSLGVVLFELLTGQRPYRFQSHSPAEIARVVCDTEPDRPSAIVSSDANRGRRLRGDLDTIVLMALRKDPARRYAAADAFAADIRRHLEGLPVNARPDTLSYRATKFVRRNKLGVTAAVLFVFALIAGIAGTWWQARKAERRFDDLRQLANVMMFDVEPKIAMLAGATEARQTLVAHGVRYLDRLAAAADDDAKLQLEVAEGFRKLAEVQGNPYTSNLGQLAEAEKSYRKSLDALQRLARRRPKDADVLESLALTTDGYADIRHQTGDLAETEAAYRAAADAFDRAGAIRPLSLRAQRSRAAILAKRADVLGHQGMSNLGRTAEALAEHQRALALREKLYAQYPGDARLPRDVAESLTKIGYIQNANGNYAAAADANRRAVALMSALVAKQPDNANDQQDLSSAYLIASLPLREIGRHEEALQNLRTSYSIIRRLADADPSSALWLRNISVIHNHLGETRAEIGDYAGAADDATQAIAIAETLWRDQQGEDAALDLIISLRRSLEPLHHLGQHAALERNARRAFEVLATRDISANARARYERALITARLGRSLAVTGRAADGLQHLGEARRAMEELIRATPDDTQRKDELATTLLYTAEIQSRIPDSPACASYSAAAQIWRDLRSAGKLRARSAPRLAEAEKALATCTATVRN